MNTSDKLTKQIPKGYKQTELGAIPEDWDVKQFVEVMDGFSSGQTPYRAIKEYYTGNIPWITSGELNYNIITNTLERITESAVKETNLKIIPKGTFLMAITGLEAAGTRGSCAITGIEATTNQSCMALYPKTNKLITSYLYHYYVQYGDELALKYCQGTKQQSYTGSIAKKLPIILPPTVQEQQAIAEALSDADALISSLDKLIAKKRDIKQATMQQLLTGTTRLPGFTGEWEVKKLGEVATFSGGAQPDSSFFSSTSKEGYIRLIQIRDYKTSDFITYIPESLAKKKCKKDDIMIGRYGPPIFQILRGLEGAYNVALIKAIPSKDIDKEYLYYFLKQDSLFAFIEALSQRSSGQTGVDMDGLKNYPFPYPLIEEQQAITQVLSDIDAEIKALEAKIEKQKALKQSMMQTLLTGKIRLVK